MKKYSLTILILILGLSTNIPLHAQTPQGINYQAVARDDAGELLVNTGLKVQFTLLQDTTMTEVYRETHQTTTNVYGLFNLVIGTGTADLGSFEDISRSCGPHFLKVELDARNDGLNIGNAGVNGVYVDLASRLAKPEASLKK